MPTTKRPKNPARTLPKTSATRAGGKKPSNKSRTQAATKRGGAMTKARSSPSPASDGLAYVEGKILPLARATIPLNDRGFLLGDGVFETLRASNGRIFRLDDHRARMARALKTVLLDESLMSEFDAAVAALLAAGTKALGGDLYLRVMVTTGPMEDVLGTGRGVAVLGLCKKFKPYPMLYYSQGISVITSRQRKWRDNPLSTVKTLSFLKYVTARREAHAQAVHDAILLNDAGRVAEGSTSNIFAFADGRLHAPGESEGAIAGVTRQAVLEFVRDIGYEVVEQLDTTTLGQADEVWFTNTTGGIIPVTRIDGAPVGNGQKGELATKLSHALEAAIRGRA